MPRLPFRSWPDLPLAAWSETYATLHLFTQIVGKVRLAQSPWVNHSWHVTLYVTARGLTTSPIPYGARTFQIEFDFVDHELRVLSSDGPIGGFPLQPQSVAACRKPNEVAGATHRPSGRMSPLRMAALGHLRDRPVMAAGACPSCSTRPTIAPAPLRDRLTKLLSRWLSELQGNANWDDPRPDFQVDRSFWLA